MATLIEPRWLKSVHTQGLDHLGLQIISITIYGELLPGITNVTDRIRYYSFYPWLLHRYAIDIGSTSLAKWQEHLRRAEFLLALLAKEHHVEGREGGEALVGADTADVALKELRASPGKSVKLSTWTAISNAGEPGSYFKNKNGGYGQYYRGVLSELGIVSIAEDSIGAKLHPTHGKQLADICDAQPGRAEFWQAVREDSISLDCLHELGGSLCPCCLSDFPEERGYLTAIIFGADGLLAPTQSNRARSLRLLLTMCQQMGDVQEPVQEFRKIAYYGHNSNGVRFEPPTPLQSELEKWRIYQTGEFAHFPMEQMLRAVLELLHNEEAADARVDRFLDRIVDLALSHSSKTLGLSSDSIPWRDRTVEDLLTEARQSQRPLAEFNSAPWSEFNLQPDVQQDEPAVAIAKGFGALVSLVARNQIPEEPFSNFESLRANFRRGRTVNLATLRDFVLQHKNESIANTLRVLLADYTIGQHILVAMRKLRHQQQSTFKLALEEGRYIWIEDFKPTYTNPRLRQAFRFLRDLGLCQCESGSWKITPHGSEVLEGSHAS